MEGLMVFALLLICLSAPAPEASFELDEEGCWVKMRLSRGNPAKVVAFGPGGPFADGETDEKGVGTIFLPPGVNQFLIGIKIAGKECDLIPIQRHGNKLTPARVSLSFGTRPCCTLPAKPRDGQLAPEDEPDWVLLALLAGGGVCVVTAVALAARYVLRVA
jgi:hypothetical protein